MKTTENTEAGEEPKDDYTRSILDLVYEERQQYYRKICKEAECDPEWNRMARESVDRARKARGAD